MNDFALLLTWTCYGTWLPGDARGYVSNTRSKRGGFEPLQNAPGAPVTADDADSRDLARRLLKHPAVRLSSEQAFVTADAIVAAATERSWEIVQGAVMANHVHVVVRNCPDDASAVRRILKGVSQADLGKQARRPQRWWSQGGSDRYLHGSASIEAAVKYVASQQFMLVRIERNVVLPC